MSLKDQADALGHKPRTNRFDELTPANIKEIVELRALDYTWQAVADAVRDEFNIELSAVTLRVRVGRLHPEAT